MDEPDPSAYQPTLTRWGHTWRLILMVLISGLGWSETILGQWRDQPYLLVIEIALGLAGYVLVFYRRSSPLTVALVLAVFAAFSALAAGPALLAAVSLATRRIPWQIVVIAVVNTVAGQAYVTFQPIDSPDPALVTLTANIAVIAAFISWGMYVGSRRELLWTLRRRAEEAEADQEFRLAQARLAERALIAREMHDVLAHRITHISLQAGALAFRQDLSRTAVREGADLIQQRSREALNDLRDVLGVLRDDTRDGAPTSPQPTLDGVPQLIEESRRAGQTVDFVDDLDHSDRLSDVVGRTIYRAVQEGLTNAGRHAPDSVLSIALAGSPTTGVALSMTNPLSGRNAETTGSGLGLVGLRERVELRGGRLDRRVSATTFILAVWIPWAS